MALNQFLSRMSAPIRALTRQRRRLTQRSFLDPAAFERAATGERMRVDRNGSVLAILLIRFPEPSHEAHDYCSAVLEERLRLTDTVGVIRDGRLGVLLPDTPQAGAWKVAEDVQELLSGGGEKLDCEVLMYPEHRGSSPWADEEQVVEGAAAADVSAAVADAATAISTSDPIETLFATPLPWWKRATDIVVGGTLLVVASPVIAASAAAVSLTSRGGPFFLQQREGLGGRRFAIYKIRTMVTDAEARKSELRTHSEQDGPAFKMSRDPRVTTVGRLLRALSLDELPQLLNVVRGEMSLVGPRPLPVDESRRCLPWQRRRLHVTPGITCTWQVRGRNIVPFDEWIRMDLEYVRTRSWWNDMKLIAETAPALVFSKGPR